MAITINSDSNSRVSVNDNQGIDLITNAIPRARISTTGLQSSVVPDLSGSNTNLFNEYKCRAWVNFDGQGATQTTGRGSGNILSVTRTATGEYLITFINNMPDANYCAIASPDWSYTGSGVSFRTIEYTVSSYKIRCIDNSANYFNPAIVCSMVIR